MTYTFSNKLKSETYPDRSAALRAAAIWASRRVKGMMSSAAAAGYARELVDAMEEYPGERITCNVSGSRFDMGRNPKGRLHGVFYGTYTAE